jgi:hypothetical protein
MNNQEANIPIEEDPHALMERTFIQEYLKGHGHTLESLHELPEAQAKKLMAEASVYASSKLTEMEARAHFVGEVHGTTTQG